MSPNGKAKALSQTPFNFAPGEFTLIALARNAMSDAAVHHMHQLQVLGPVMLEDERDHHTRQGKIAARRTLHFSLYAMQGALLRQECTYQALQLHRAILFAELGIEGEAAIRNARSRFGQRYFWSNHVDPDRFGWGYLNGDFGPHGEVAFLGPQS